MKKILKRPKQSEFMHNTRANPDSPYNKKSCRDKISKNTTKQWKNASIREKMIDGIKKSWTKERCNKMKGDNNPAKSLQARNKISQKLSGKKKPKWLIENLAEIHRGRPVKTAIREKIRKTQLKKADEYRKRKILFHQLHPEKHPNMLLRRNHKTKIEEILIKELNNLGCVEKQQIKTCKKLKDFVFNFYIKTYNGFRFPDINFPLLKIIIECDGNYWHKNKKYERNRDLEFKNLGYKILHFSGYDIKNNLNEVKDVVRTEIIKKIERIGEGKTYDITTQKNHNFILGNGILAHNCHPHEFVGRNSQTI
jgi:very-short-patch-repair endonuclease